MNDGGAGAPHSQQNATREERQSGLSQGGRNSELMRYLQAEYERQAEEAQGTSSDVVVPFEDWLRSIENGDPRILSSANPRSDRERTNAVGTFDHTASMDLRQFNESQILEHVTTTSNMEQQNEREDDNNKAMMTATRIKNKRNRGVRLTQRRKSQAERETERAAVHRVREQEDEREQELRKQRDAERKRSNRAFESRRVREGRIMKIVDRRNVREEQDESHRVVRNRANSTRMRQTRTQETQDQRRARIQNVTQRRNIRSESERNRLHEVTRNLARRHIDGEHTVETFDVGNLSEVCAHCNALYFKGEIASKSPDGQFTKCCKKGDLRLDDLFENYPEDLYKLFTNNDRVYSKNFKENVRNFNSAFAFASMKAESHIRDVMPFCYKIQGQIYHTVNLAAHPDPNEKPEYAQLFFIDTEEALNLRMQNTANASCDRNLMRKIDEVMRNISPYYEIFKCMREVEEEVERSAALRGETPPKLKLLFDVNANVDRRRYNIPRSNEVAAVFVLNDRDELPSAEGLAIHQRGRQLQRISKFEKRAESMLYPLYFPTGHGGCYANMRVNNKKITFAQYYRYMIAIRKSSALIEKKDSDRDFNCFADYMWNPEPGNLNDFNPIRLGGKLYQQYLVDAYVKVEQDRLDYVRQNQKVLKVENYKALRDYLECTADEQGKRVGRTIILPSSFKGSPRHCQQGYQDSMALVRRFGKPDLFITFTCNPNWDEITRNLQPSNKVLDEPDLVDRVFHLKLKELIDDLKKKEYLGRILAYTYVIEFQKRGLPHAHILLILDNESKIRTAEDIDNLVWAEIPDKNRFPRLHSIVTSHMIHGPCGIHNMNAPCMVDDKNGNKYCSKKFPKEFREETAMGTDSYAYYRRRSSGNVIERNGVSVDNRWVVPYNPFLSLKYNAHINVEICASIKSVKYLYKYVYKGYDCARMTISVGSTDEIVHDEVKTFLNLRYVTPHEGFWRLIEFTMDEKSHAVTKLDVHLPNEQIVCYRPNNDNIRERLNDAELRNTTLTAWFELNQRDSQARAFYYYEIPEHFTFKKAGNNMSWERKGGTTGHYPKQCIGRMYAIHPKQGELFYLRMILLHRKGATGWEDLLVTEEFDNDPRPKQTFQDAARAMGLLDGNIQWMEYFTEAKDFASPFQLREMFVAVITHGENVDVRTIWRHFKQYFAEDYSMNYESDAAERRALIDIQRQLEDVGNTMRNYGIDVPEVTGYDPEQQWDANEGMERGNTMRASMNEAQESIVTYVLQKIEEKTLGTLTNGCVFIDGPGGSGKTYTYRTLCHLFRGRGIKYKTSSWMGIAANLMPDGRTMHKVFGLPFEMDPNASSTAKLNNKTGRELLDTTVFIIDEISMVPKFAIEIIDRKLRELTEMDLPFGGKIIIIGGDFRQILPVQKKASRSELTALSVVKSHLWPLFKVFRLRENHRVLQGGCDDAAITLSRKSFAEWLLNLGNGELHAEEDFVEIPDTCISRGDLIADVFGELIANDNIEELSKRVILTTTNERVHEINTKVLELMKNHEEKTYLSVDRVDTNEPNATIEYPAEFLHSYNESGLPPHELKLKMNCPVMLKRNLNPSAGLCNGTRLRVKALHRNLIECEFITGERAGQHTFIPRITLTSGKGLPFTLHRKQFPLALCYAMTINKSQGQTIEFAGLDMVYPVFSHGMTYVAFSRVRGWDRLKVAVDKESRVKNLVWKEVLLEDEEEESQRSLEL
ncbi:hypothetical protein ANCCAN_26434 [Ancylostoma caninum]|uniref:ATP-dependent DNA helicase n=1 Tax=Ancylostoma caninum TaxID=29170 RepID=A0A368F9Z6_ANCCA|nr:hypothetical protein ANCCAN_26434 [Ancylostoma caninum]